jgi:hypothetical protein
MTVEIRRQATTTINSSTIHNTNDHNLIVPGRSRPRVMTLVLTPAASQPQQDAL